MSINDRVRELRKSLGLNQTDFSGPLGLKQTTIAGYENGARSVSEASIIAICREYGVNEEWLRNGVGEPFVAGSVAPSIVSDIAKEYDLDLMDQNLISEYLKLDKHDRAVLKNYIKRVFLASDENAAIDREVESYRAELEAEKGEKSSASDIGNAKEA